MMVSSGEKKSNRKKAILRLCLDGATISQMQNYAERYVSKDTAKKYVIEVIEFVQKQHKKNQVVKDAK